MRLANRSIRQQIIAGAAVAVLVAVMLVSGRAALAQSASPVASPESVDCSVDPRSDEDLARLAALAATPVASPEVRDTYRVQDHGGEEVDEQTLAAVETTLAQVAACTASGEVARLMALYTDEYIVREVLATEPVPIVPGTPSSVERMGTPEAVGSAFTVLEARMLPDGRVVAGADRDGQVETIILVEDDGRWVIDRIIEGDDVVESPLLPPVQAAVAHAAVAAGAPTSEVTVVAAEPTVWPDSSLGCPQPGQFYAQVETPGYIVTLEVDGTNVTYHTDEGEAVVPCDNG